MRSSLAGPAALYYEDGLEIEYRLTSSEWVNLPLDEGTGKSYYLDHQPEIEQEIIENRLETLVANHNLTVDEQGFVHFSKGSPANQ